MESPRSADEKRNQGGTEEDAAAHDAESLAAELLAQNIQHAAAFGQMCGQSLAARSLPLLGGTISQN